MHVGKGWFHWEQASLVGGSYIGLSEKPSMSKRTLYIPNVGKIQIFTVTNQSHKTRGEYGNPQNKYKIVKWARWEVRCRHPRIEKGSG